MNNKNIEVKFYSRNPIEMCAIVSYSLMMETQISHLPDEIVVNDNIILRAKTSESYEEFARVVVENIDHLSRWLPWAKDAPNQSSIDHYNQAKEKKQNNESADWDIFVNNQFVGAIGLLKRNPNDLHLEIGYWLKKDAIGNGIASKAVQTLIKITFEQVDVPHIEIACDIENKKSAAIAIRNGLTLDRELPRPPDSEHTYETAQFYRISRENWEANKG